jgi:ABC-2 type transport system ATP-binding protein
MIEVHGLTKRFGPVLAVDQLSFQVERGTVVGFLGPNGAGKTTTLRMLLGLVRPDEGTAAINGQAYRELAEPLHQVGVVLDASGFHPGRTARDHLRVQAMAGQADPSRIDDVLELAGLAGAAGRRVGGFSLGMRQRLGLAGALLCDPEVLILDEPANGLDPEGVRWLRDLVRGMAAEGAAVLVSSHILAEVAQTVDSVVILDHGRLVVQSSLADLTAGAQKIVRVRTPQAEDLRAAMVADGAGAALLSPDRVEIVGSTPERVATVAAGRSIPVVESVTEAADLEDVFLRLTAGPSRPAPADHPARPAQQVAR